MMPDLLACIYVLLAAYFYSSVDTSPSPSLTSFRSIRTAATADFYYDFFPFLWLAAIYLPVTPPPRCRILSSSSSFDDFSASSPSSIDDGPVVEAFSLDEGDQEVHKE